MTPVDIGLATLAIDRYLRMTSVTTVDTPGQRISQRPTHDPVWIFLGPVKLHRSRPWQSPNAPRDHWLSRLPCAPPNALCELPFPTSVVKTSARSRNPFRDGGRRRSVLETVMRISVGSPGRTTRHAGTGVRAHRNELQSGRPLGPPHFTQKAQYDAPNLPWPRSAGNSRYQYQLNWV